MVDTGAAFSMVSVEFVRRFGLQVGQEEASFQVASGDSAQLVGITSFTLQVADELEMELEGVRVIRPK